MFNKLKALFTNNKITLTSPTPSQHTQIVLPEIITVGEDLEFILEYPEVDQATRVAKNIDCFYLSLDLTTLRSIAVGQYRIHPQLGGGEGYGVHRFYPTGNICAARSSDGGYYHGSIKLGEGGIYTYQYDVPVQAIVDWCYDNWDKVEHLDIEGKPTLYSINGLVFSIDNTRGLKEFEWKRVEFVANDCLC